MIYRAKSDVRFPNLFMKERKRSVDDENIMYPWSKNIFSTNLIPISIN